MAIDSQYDLLQALLQATKPTQVQQILAEIGDTEETDLDRPFGKEHYQWHVFGDTDTNISAIGYGSKPGRSLIERITNAIDALLEQRIAEGAPPPASPMEAVGKWYGRPASSHDAGLFLWEERQFLANDTDRLVQVVLSLGDKPSAPCVDVMDKGIGLRPEEFADTILSLQKGNKIKRPYLSGVFGQGGASTLGFSQYVLVVSRHFQHPDEVGFTLIKLKHLAPPYRVDAYAYLAVKDATGSLVVPSARVAGAIDVYPRIAKVNEKPRPLEHGTLIRHYGYELPNLAGTLQGKGGNLYHMTHYMLFDPLLPFRVYDLRNEQAVKHRRISGARNRLMNRVLEKAEADASDSPEEASVTIRHHFQREMVSLRENSLRDIGIEYWVVFAYEKGSLRAYSNELFVERGHPIVATLNGQNQGEIPAKLLAELDLQLVARHIAVHIDATEADLETKRLLFASTREGFRDGEAYEELKRVLKSMLKDDPELDAIEQELEARGTSRERNQTSNAVRQQISKLLREQGVQVKHQDTDAASGNGSRTGTPDGADAGNQRHIRRPLKPLPPLPTLPFPDVTRFDIVDPSPCLTLHQGEVRPIRIETDASFQFDRMKRIAIRSEPSRLDIASESPLDHGRKTYRLRAMKDSLPGDKGLLIATITRLDGSQLESKVSYEILAPRPAPTGATKVTVPDFEVVAVDPRSDPETFSRIWPSIAADEVMRIAYRLENESGGLVVYYSLAFDPFHRQMEILKTKPNLAKLFQEQYEVWIGYHAIMQWRQGGELVEADIEEDVLEGIRERERATMAAVQVKQAYVIAEMQSRMQKYADSDD